MILQDFIAVTANGLYCAYGDFYLDPKFPVINAVISHAHGDHAVPGNRRVYCTVATREFMKHRYKKNAAAEFMVIDYGAEFEINGIIISFYPAGHILGSAMILMRFKGVSYLYTGDYKLAKDPTCESIQFVNADVLITETTFANPGFDHPVAEDEIKKLNGVQSNIMLGAYALGKSQRLTTLINSHCTHKRILVHHSILPFMKIYNDFGIDLGLFEIYDRKVMKKQSTGIVYIVPPMVFNSYIRAVNVVRIFASGWKHLQQKNDVQLYISDHVDWKELLTTIQQVNPKEVWTTHGSGDYLKKHFDQNLVVKLLS